MNTISMLRPEGLFTSPYFSQVAVIPPGATVIQVGGQNAVDATGAMVGGDDVVAQTRQVMSNLQTALAGAGAGMADLVSISVVMVTGVDVSAAYAEAAKVIDPDSDPPLVTVSLVAGLAVPGALVEVSATAAVMR